MRTKHKITIHLSKKAVRECESLMRHFGYLNYEELIKHSLLALMIIKNRPKGAKFLIEIEGRTYTLIGELFK